MNKRYFNLLSEIVVLKEVAKARKFGFGMFGDSG